MLGHFGFSYVGLLYMLMMVLPNILWARRQPEGYDSSGENKVLQVFERIGQVLCTVALLLFSDYNPRSIEPWTVWLFLSAALMVLYEVFWIRYFRSKRTVADFYRGLWGIPAPGATLPVTAFLLLGIYGKVIWLIGASIIFGVGHVGIHLQHMRKLNKSKGASSSF